MNINDFVFMPSAQFYKKNNSLTKKTINQLFIELSKHKKGNYIFREIKKFKNKSYYSLLCFKYEETPNFLINKKHLEIKFAMLLIIEHLDYIIIIQKNIYNNKLLKDKLDYYDLPDEYFFHFQSINNPRYRKISANNMNIGSNAIAKRSYSTYGDLTNILSPTTTSRSILNNFTFKAGTSWSITPSTNRIREEKSSINIVDIINWAINVCLLLGNKYSSQFINKFAKKIELRDVIEKYNIISIFINLHELNELFNSSEIKITHEKKPLNDKEINRFFDFFKNPLKIKENKYRNYGEVKINKKSFSLRSKYLNNIKIHFPDTEISVLQYINRNKLLQCMFNSPKYAYYNGNCYVDESITNIIPSIHHILIPKNFSQVTSEKSENEITPSSTSFPKNSLFKHIEDIYNQDGTIIICDDLGNEWADHIILTKSQICYVHEKHVNKSTLGASYFHEVVSQATKNLIHINSSSTEYLKKYDSSSWDGFYKKSKIKLFRVVGKSNLSTEEEKEYLSKRIDTLHSNPNTVKKVIIATPFLSKKKLLKKFEDIKNKKNIKPHIPQLLWLLSWFIGSCREYGIQVEILCSQ